MKLLKSKLAFTLIELLVVITIIAILAGIALPVFTSVQIKGQQTKALSNAKQIALALRLYASDNNGLYPSYTLNQGQPSTTTVANSNEAFAQLFPTYIQEEAIFWLAKSAWCTANPPPETYDAAGTDPNVLTLAAGQNEWAYVLGLNDSSNPAMPLIADGFTGQSGPNTTHTYTVDQSVKGGIWKAQKAIIVHADSSGVVANVTQSTGANQYQVVGPNGSVGNTQGDIFTTGNSGNGWLGQANEVVNPW
jgi:prepilin-type N-terminal cleavage/methylation domain-containing protein